MFQLLRSKADVIYLQETHLDTAEKESLWQMEWGGGICSSYGDSNACRVAILYNDKCKLKSYKSDQDGQVICCEVEINSSAYVLCNIYAPNQDILEFFEKVIDITENFENQHSVIFSGDFNMVMDPHIDRCNSTRNHMESHAVWTEYMERAHLNDVWRDLHLIPGTTHGTIGTNVRETQQHPGLTCSWYLWG